MAYLYEDDEETHESWLAWAIELMRRGLRPIEGITVHGPHAPPGDRMWGNAECETPDGGIYDVEFTTPRCKSIWDVRGIRVLC